MVPRLFNAHLAHDWNQSLIQQIPLDKALLHSVLGITLEAQSKFGLIASSTQVSADVTMHKTSSIAGVNQRLRDPSQAVQLSTLMTVSILLSHEVGPDHPLQPHHLSTTVQKSTNTIPS